MEAPIGAASHSFQAACATCQLSFSTKDSAIITFAWSRDPLKHWTELAIKQNARVRFTEFHCYEKHMFLSTENFLLIYSVMSISKFLFLSAGSDFFVSPYISSLSNK